MRILLAALLLSAGCCQHDKEIAALKQQIRNKDAVLNDAWRLSRYMDERTEAARVYRTELCSLMDETAAHRCPRPAN